MNERIPTRRTFIKDASVAVVGLSAASQIVSATSSAKPKSKRNRKPNFIFVQPDSWNGRCLSMLREPGMKRATPNIERIAGKGAFFENTYCNNPVCCPSRASMRSGLYTHHCKGWNNYKGLSPDDPIFNDSLKQAGYLFANDKGGFGKSDYLSGAHSQLTRVASWTAPANIQLPVFRMGSPVIGEDREKAHDRDWNIVEQGIQFLETHADSSQPFFLYLGLGLPHPPFAASRKYVNQVDVEEVSIPPEDKQLHPVMAYQRINKNWEHGFEDAMVRNVRTIYYGMIAEADAMIGQLYDCMKALGLADNTYFIFTSDHGENNMEHHLYYKMNLYESSARVPLVIVGPGIEKGLRLDNIVSLVDIFPTLMDMAGLETPKGLDGESLLPLATGQTKTSRNYAVAERTGMCGQTPSFMLRKGHWKYIAFPGYEPMLFDLSNDYYEVDNIAQANPDKVKEMDAELRRLVDYEAVTRELIDYNRKSFNQWYDEHSKKPIHLKEYGADNPQAYADDILNNTYIGFNQNYKDKLMYWAKG